VLAGIIIGRTKDSLFRRGGKADEARIVSSIIDAAIFSKQVVPMRSALRKNYPDGEFIAGTRRGSLQRRVGPSLSHRRGSVDDGVRTGLIRPTRLHTVLARTRVAR